MKAQLLEKKSETPDVTTFIFKPLQPMTWKAGQFAHHVMYHRPTDERGSDRWFTISAAPFEETIRITTRHSADTVSTFKTKLFSLKEGRKIEISDIDGDFVVEDLTKEYVFIAGGIGITPFRSILKQLDHEKKQIDAILLYSNRDQNIIFKEELEQLAKNNPNFHIHYIFSPEHIDEKKIRELVPDLQKPIFYVSGPEPMVESLGNTLKEMGVKEENLKQDFFPGYPAE